MQKLALMLKIIQGLGVFLILIISPATALIAVVYLIMRQLLLQTRIFDLLVLVITGFIAYQKSGYLYDYVNLVIEYYHNFDITSFIVYQIKNINFTQELFLIVLLMPLSAVCVLQDFLVKLHQPKSLIKDPLEDGVILADGINPVFLTDSELNQHTLIIGTTGSGKTTTIMNFIESAAKRNIPVVFLDGKGAVDLINKMSQIAKNYQRKFRVFTLRPRENMPNLAGYNPFANGNATEWKNRIMSLFAAVEGKGQEHFAMGEQNYINFVANVLAKLPARVDLRLFLAFLENPEKLLALAHEIEPEIGKKLATLQKDGELNTLIGDVVKLLELFIYSDYGYLFNTLDMENVITLKEAILNKELILFQFDASSYPEDTRKVAKMVISDINSSFASFNEFTKCYCIFDEFASYASSNLAETISLHRSNGMHAIIGTQSIETVKLKSSETRRIAEELIACCNT